MISTSIRCLIFSVAVALAAGSSTACAQNIAGHWNANLKCRGGDIAFGLELTQTGEQWSGYLINGPERIKIPSVSVKENSISIKIDHYDSHLDLELSLIHISEPTRPY